MITISIKPLVGLLILGLILAAGGCEDAKDPRQIPVTEQKAATPIVVETPTPRFKVESQGYFEAGLENHKREIIIITDTKTGKEYLGITGVGVSEMFQNGKHKAEE